MVQRIVRICCALIVTLQPLQAMAVEADLANTTTGADSDNANTATVTGTVSVSITNTGTATNTFDLTLNTGANTIEDNTTVGDVTTGDISFDIVAETTINDQLLDLANGTATSAAALATKDEVKITSENRSTGAGSTNTNDTTVDRTTTITQTNTATVANTVTADVNTGDNVISSNTTVGDITTGDIVGTFDIKNRLNSPDRPPVSPINPPPFVIQEAPKDSRPVGDGGGVDPKMSETQPSSVQPPQGSGTPIVLAQAQPAEPTQQLFAPRDQFFPAGGSLPTLPELLGLGMIAYLLAIGLQVIAQFLKRHQTSMYRLAYAAALL